MRSRGFWIALLIVPIPIVVGMVVASIWMSLAVREGETVGVYFGTLGWFVLSLVTAIACSIWVKGKVTLGLWIGLLIAAIILVIVFGIATGLFG